MLDLDIKYFFTAEAINLFVRLSLPSSRQGHLQKTLVPCELTVCRGHSADEQCSPTQHHLHRISNTFLEQFWLKKSLTGFSQLEKKGNRTVLLIENEAKACARSDIPVSQLLWEAGDDPPLGKSPCPPSSERLASKHNLSVSSWTLFKSKQKPIADFQYFLVVSSEGKAVLSQRHL